MGIKLETGLLNLEVEQYAGKGQDQAGIARLAATARKVEELGFDSAMMPEAGMDPYLPLMIAAEHTKRVTLGTNVAIAFPRSPLVTAQMAWDLQRYSGGRFQLGLGTQVKGHNERRYASPWTGAPGPRLRDYILCLRAMFASFQNPKQPTYFKGEHYQFTLMPPFFNPGPIDHPEVPIYVAVVNKYMARMAGELCDGVRLHPIATFKYTREVIIPTVAAGAQKAGRPLSAIDIVGAPFLAVGATPSDVEAAKAAAKQRISFYASTRTYHSVLEFHGWADIGMKLHRMSVENRWQEMPALITDQMLDEFAIVGTFDDIVPQLREKGGDVFTTVLLDMPPALRADEARVRRIIAELR